MSILLATQVADDLHDPGPDHPERPERVRAVLSGIDDAGVADDMIAFRPRRATRDEVTRVHHPDYLARLEWRGAHGEALDPDTPVGPGSYEAALRAAGAGLEAVERLDAGEALDAFLAVRPPGHHALSRVGMGFCLLNNIAITASALVARGERVLILDWDAHHGNGTQAAFYDEPEVLFVSLHQYPAYPGTGALEEVGEGAGAGTTINLPFPAGTSGDAYRRAFDEVIVPAAEEFGASWLLVSAGFDAHRADPITDLGLSAGDFSDLTARVLHLGHPGRRIFFLEGGYDLEALAMSAGACVAALAGVRYLPERPSVADSRGADERALAVIAAAARRHGEVGAR